MERVVMDTPNSTGPAIKFSEVGAFSAIYAAEAFMERCGFSVGSASRGDPLALMFGHYDIAKWRDLTRAERDSVHGLIVGDRREGPVFVRMTPSCPPEGLRAFSEALDATELSRR